MKKIYLCAMALSVGSLSFGQSLTKQTFSKEKLQHTASVGKPSTAVTTSAKAPGDVLWSEDFNASTALPTGFSVLDNTMNNAIWVVQAQGTLPDADFTTGQTTINSASAGNCMLLYSDLYESPMPPGGYYDMDSYFQTGAISLNNVAGVSVNFQQLFRRCCAINPAPVTVLAVSTDPTFATGVQEYDIIGGIGGNITSPDPMDMSINISAVAAGLVGDIYLRFHVKSGTDSYFWMIDDIQVVESSTNDIVTSAGSAHFFGVEYSMIPSAQVQPMSASMIYNNIGTADQTNTNLTVTVDDGTTATPYSTANATILSLENDTIEWDSLWTPPATIGVTYTVTLDILSDDFTDSTPANNTQTMTSFTVTSGLMALDDNNATGSTGGNNGPGGITEYEAGNQFDCTVDAPLYSIDLFTGTGTPLNTFIDVVLYQVDFSTGSAVYNELWRSASYATTPADVAGGVAKFYDNIGTPIANLVAGETYIAAVHSFIDY
jgi:hypothetical protein